MTSSDLLNLLLQFVPPQWAVVFFAVCGVFSAVAAALRPPAAPTGFYAGLYRVVNFVAINFGHATNLTAPTFGSAANTVKALAWFLAPLGLLALATCGQQARVEAGILCAADVSGHVVATAASTDPDGVKAVNSAVVAGSILLTDAACHKAATGG